MSEHQEETDYYAVLGLGPAATFDDVVAAFHTLAIRYHPDTGHDDIRMFKLLAEAYHVLSDEQKRREYDRRSGHRVAHHENSQGTASPISAATTWPSRDLELDLPISPEEAKYGGTCEIVITFDDRCLPCSETSRRRAESCPLCGGRGYHRRREQLQFQIPSGVRGKPILRLVGRGKLTNSGRQRGDVLLRLTIKPYW